MAAWFYFVLLLIPPILAEVNDDCWTPWNVTLQNPLHITWDGDDRNTDVRIVAKLDTDKNSTWQTGCGEQSEKTTFGVRELRLEPFCANATFSLTVSLICKNESEEQANTFIFETDYVEAPSNVNIIDVTNSSIKIEWDEPYSDANITAYHVGEVKTDFAVENIYHTVPRVYEFRRLTPYTEYFFVVRARTETTFGPWSEIIRGRTEEGVPTAPTHFKALNITENSILVSWDAPEHPNGPSLEYVVSWGARGTRSIQVPVANNETEYLAVGLEPYTEYLFQVAAGTSVGFGPYTKNLLVRTKIGLPSEPKNLTETFVTRYSIKVEWDSPDFPNGPILGYVIQLSEYPNGTIEEKETNETSMAFGYLKAYTVYVIRVAARTEAGTGPFSEDLQVTTRIGVPGLPKNVSSTCNAISITLTWEEPDVVPGTSLQYWLSWGVRGTPATLVILDKSTHRYDAVGLRPYTEYQFIIAARTEAGNGDAETLIVRTDIAAPSSPRQLTVVERYETSVLLKWLPPEHPNGPDLNYTVKWVDSEDNWSRLETIFVSASVENLKPSTNYSVFVMASNLAGDGYWSPALSATTREKKHPKNSHLVLALVLGIMLPLIVILLILGFIVARKKGLFDDFRPRSREPSQEMQPPKNTIQVIPIERIARSFTVHNFLQKTNTITRYGQAGFLQEYEELKKESPQHSTNAAKVEENLTKNRWVKILPFDHSRVKIYPNGTANQSNFINANYIPGESHILEYIATQGPLPNTVNDFWTLVWQQSVPIAVMLTQCVERAVKNCEKYWPAAGESKLYGDIRVQTKQETMLTSHIMRVFLVQYQNQQRHIVHMHFTNWPVSGTPRDPVDFLHFIRLVREQVSERRPGPILVHCSAGVGRTGTFIAVDRLMQHLQMKEDIDIYNTVLELRRYRPHMVHTMEQYVFVYNCVQQMILDLTVPQETIYDSIT